MNNHLKLVSHNPDKPASSPIARLDGRALHSLADMLTAEVQAGHSDLAHVLASLQRLSPFAIAVVASWMTRAGLSEAEILKVVV